MIGYARHQILPQKGVSIVGRQYSSAIKIPLKPPSSSWLTISKSLFRLEQLPESGAIPKDRIMMSSGYRFLVHNDYLLFYNFVNGENTAYILAVLHAKRDYMRVMKKFL